MANQTLPVKPATKEERVHAIVDMMARGDYVTGVTYRDLAVAWGMHPTAVQLDVAEASRLLRAQINTDEIRARIVATLETIAKRCAKSGSNVQETKNAIRALEALGRVIGTPRPSITIQGGAHGPAIQVVMLPPEDHKPPVVTIDATATSGSANPEDTLEAEPGPSNIVPGK